MQHKDYSIKYGKANFLGLLATIPFTVILLVPFLIVWGIPTLKSGMAAFARLPVILGGIAAHELLHGLGWLFFARKGIRSIRFGIKWKSLNPYCHCKEPLRMKHYVTGAILPFLTLGIIPSIWGLCSGNAPVFSFGLFSLWLAGSDLLVLFDLNKVSLNTWVMDHPDKIGFLIQSDKIEMK